MSVISFIIMGATINWYYTKIVKSIKVVQKISEKVSKGDLTAKF